MALTVVTGPPAAGKTTWVMARAKRGDVVIDFDILAQALTGPGGHSHNHGRHVRGVAFRARSAAITEALRIARTAAVYIVHACPSDDAMRRYLDAGAFVVTIDPGREVVMARVAEQRSATASRVADRWYRSDHAQQSVTGSASRRW